VSHLVDEDRAELEAHFQERVQAYIELGETPEQAEISAVAKFGEVEATLKELRRQRVANRLISKSIGVMGLGLVWGLLFAMMFAALVGGISAFRPLRADVGLAEMIAIIGGVGCISGGIFGALLALAENGKSLRDISLARVAWWGMLAAAVYPLLTGRENQPLWTSPFGAIAALTVVALAQGTDGRGRGRSGRLRWKLSACVAAPVRNAIGPIKKPGR